MTAFIRRHKGWAFPLAAAGLSLAAVPLLLALLASPAWAILLVILAAAAVALLARRPTA